LLRANDGKLRLFGFGSLCWNPGKPGSSALAHESVTITLGKGSSALAHESATSTLGKPKGYRRAWAKKRTDHRGLPEFPCLVCTLLTDQEFR
jgi:cation transport regulator ChaC